MIATGEFEVNLKSMDAYAQGEDGVQLGRLSIDKIFRGDLAATSKGEMLSAMTNTQGSAGYVAIEQVSGTLAGKYGRFVLQHFGIINGDQNRLVLEVVPNSGTGELVGLAGKMVINIENSNHLYEFEYELT